MSVYDRAKLHVRQSDVAKVYVYVHGGNCKIESEGNVMVRYKRMGTNTFLQYIYLQSFIFLNYLNGIINCNQYLVTIR